MEALIWPAIFLIVIIVINWQSIVDAIIEFIQGLFIVVATIVGIGMVGALIISIIQSVGIKNIFITISIIVGTLIVVFLLYNPARTR